MGVVVEGVRGGSGSRSRGAASPAHTPPPARRYMKYLYPYECETRALSSPGELQAAIDSNRREGRRQAYTAAPLFGSTGPPPRGTPGPASVPGSALPAPPPGPRPAQASASRLPALACAQLSPSPIKKGVRGRGAGVFMGL